jgi:hypothetical protein
MQKEQSINHPRFIKGKKIYDSIVSTLSDEDKNNPEMIREEEYKIYSSLFSGVLKKLDLAENSFNDIKIAVERGSVLFKKGLIPYDDYNKLRERYTVCERGKEHYLKEFQTVGNLYPKDKDKYESLDYYTSTMEMLNTLDIDKNNVKKIR